MCAETLDILIHVHMLRPSSLRTSTCTCMHSGISSSESELTSENEDQSEKRRSAGGGLMYNEGLDGEQILFPESDGEENDWIDSDPEDRRLADAPIGTEGVDSVDSDREGFIVGSDLSVRHFYFMFSMYSPVHTCTYAAHAYVHTCI